MAAALVLSACSSDPTPKEPDPSKAATPTTPAVAVPTMPPQASEDSPEGAAAFVKHYVDVFNYAAATGDVKELSAISSKCKPCSEYAEDFSSLQPSSRPQGDAWELGDVGVSTEAGNRRVQASISSLGDADGSYELLFELSSHPPFQVLDIRDRTK
ncbi:DUF6318 family protein [Aeromicrobium endophyticum]|uniref:DUF6318 family protein n=1 Tax=Aeromicrobium endophyticum TaxID=2292704 RepID=UPI000E6AF625|nr:DUF6318 family protein [Aeromicrobium endophyticum]